MLGRCSLVVLIGSQLFGCSGSPEGPALGLANTTGNAGNPAGLDDSSVVSTAGAGTTAPSGAGDASAVAGTAGTGTSAGTATTTGVGGAGSTTPGGVASTTGGAGMGMAPTGMGGTTATGAGVGGAGLGAAGVGGAADPAVGGASVGGAGGVVPTDDGVLADLTAFLDQDPATRGGIADQPFAELPLSAAQAATARDLLWEDYAEQVRSDRAAENDAKVITLGDHSLRYDFTIFGDAPDDGRSLFLSLHGGGEADAATNDSQWENQKQLYEPDEGIYLAPRAPTDTWNMWHQDHIDPLFQRLITNLIVFEGVDPNRVYVMGYSAGGDGVYQLAPRMADYWAAAAMMAGHPNDAQPLSLRNIGFTIHVGALDTAFDRNLIGEEWGTLLDNLQMMDPGGYEHEVQIHAGKPHWMDLEDAVAVPWMAEFTRDPIPDVVVWLEDDVPHQRFYWLALSEADQEAGVLVEASYAAQEVTVDTTGLDGPLEIRLDDAMLDLDQAVVVSAGGQQLHNAVVPRSIATLSRTLEERGDPEMMFSAVVSVEVP